jgi:squalene cyclase
MRSLQLYGKPEHAAVIARAAEWLRKREPKTNEDRAMRLLGLAWAKSDSRELSRAAAELLADQRQDGGWGQTATLETDAYATGQALVALYESGAVKVSDEAYQRGAGYLLRTQRADGSWLVRTRSFPLQPYKESGFPYGKDQWISAAGTSWAAMALSLTLEPPSRMESGV